MSDNNNIVSDFMSNNEISLSEDTEDNISLFEVRGEKDEKIEEEEEVVEEFHISVLPHDMTPIHRCKKKKKKR